MSSQVLIAVGANLELHGAPPAEVARQAIAALPAAGFALLAISRIFDTPAWPPGSGPDFANAALLARWSGSAPEALAALHGVEQDFERRREIRWGARTLDLDLLAMEDRIHPDPGTLRAWIDLPPEHQALQAPDRLILPHPRLQDRGFVLAPLNDVAPDWCHPLTGLSVARMLAALPPAALEGVRPRRNTPPDAGA